MKKKVKNFIYRIIHFITNHIILRLPFNLIRKFLLRYLLRMKIGYGTYIAYGVSLISPWKISIGKNCIINSYALMDGREYLEIKDNVDIGWYVKIFTLQHDTKSTQHHSVGKKVIIEQNCWIATSSIILPGCHVSEGTVIATGSVLTKDTKPFTVYAGVPAKVIKERSRSLNYVLKEPGIRI